MHSVPVCHDLSIHRRETYANPDHPIPERLTLLRPNPADPSADQLFLDQLPMPEGSWRFDPHDRIVSWRDAFDGGHIHLSADGLGATGNIGPAHHPVSVTAGARARFLCDVALDTGAMYETSDCRNIGFVWDPSSKKWQSAQWVPKRLLLTYVVTQVSRLEPPVFSFEFEDLQTQAMPWTPELTTFTATLQLGQRGPMMVWYLTFRSTVPPIPDVGDPSTGPKSVYPCWMQAIENAAASEINGVLEINEPPSQLVGMRGVRADATATGWYRTSSDAAPFGVFDGRLMIDGQAVAGSLLDGRELRWSRLEPRHQQRLGLPESGSIVFDDGGAAAAGDGVQAQRLDAGAALEAIAAHAEVHPGVQARAAALRTTLAEPGLGMYDLLQMTPFVQNAQGAWADAIQMKVIDDFGEIMNSFIPPDMWKLLFPTRPQPVLTGRLAQIASSPVPGVPRPGGWYQSLATAVLTQGLADGADPNTANLNGPRAAAWLKTEVAASKVYHAHGQLLFHDEWRKRFPLIEQFLADQVLNAAGYEAVIQQETDRAVRDITRNVIADPVTEPKLIDDLVADVRAAGLYAKSNKLYWAFAYYTYNTAPSLLAAIALGLSIRTGSSDATNLSRLFQQNAAVLTALDPSGYFARQYTNTLNTFLATNILPSMFGFLGDAMSFDVIKRYMQEFVTAGLANADKDVQAAAAQIQAILAAEEGDRVLKDSIEALRSFAAVTQDAMALPFIADRFVKSFAAKFPKFAAGAEFFGSALIGAVAGLAVFNLITVFKEWDSLDDAEKAQLIVQTIPLGLQIVGAVAKRTISIRAIFNVNGMTKGERTAAVFRILAVNGAEKLDEGLVRIGNSAARWIGDAEGAVARLASKEGVTAALATNSASSSRAARFASKVFGKSLDQFVATRLGPVLIMAGIGFSLYALAQGQSGVELAAEILNIVSGSLMLLTLAGGALIAAGSIAAGGVLATIIAAAGVLAILAALAGAALMIYAIYGNKPPNPVKTFVDRYAKPAGLYVASKASSIDYATVYANPDLDQLLMMGFTLSSPPVTFRCGPGGAISLGPAATALPECVWVAVTDGVGMSRIMTVAPVAGVARPVTLALSLMKDGTVSFQPQVPVPIPSGSPVRTQTWLSAPQGKARLTSAGQLLSLDLTLQPVLPDAKGQFLPSGASGWLSLTSTGLGWRATGSATFTLRMSPLAPNYMAMAPMQFLLNSQPSREQAFSPTFGLYPSTPVSYECTGDGLPSFLTFDTATGTFRPNGTAATEAAQLNNTITARNPAGSASTSLVITVGPLPAMT